MSLLSQYSVDQPMVTSAYVIYQSARWETNLIWPSCRLL